MPVSDIVYQLLRQLPDAIVFSMAFVLLLAKMASGRSLPSAGNGIGLALLLFIAWACLTIVVNHGADVFVGIANIKALLRYVLLMYVILLLNPSERGIRTLIKWLSIAVVAQGVIGYFQLFGGLAVRDILAARHVSDDIGGFAVNFTGDRFEEVNDLMGTMGDNISFGYFLLVGLVLFLFSVRHNGLKYWLGCAWLFILIYFSGSRAITLTAILLVVAHRVWVMGLRSVIKQGGVAALIILPLALVASMADISVESEDKFSFWFMFNKDYLEGAMNSRLGIVAYIVPEILFKLHNLVGYSPDKEFFSEYVGSYLPMVPQILIDVLPYVLEDVYWVALYVYYGAVGFFLWVLFLFLLQKRMKFAFVRAESKESYKVAGIAFSLLWLALPLNLFNQAFEVRSFSFYLWLFCGLALVMHKRLRVGAKGEAG